MSDKNRNMNDINDQKTAEQQAFSEEIRRRLAEPGSGKPALEEFKLMVYKDRERRRKKRNTLVACLVAAFIVGYLSFDALVPEVGADKNPKETIQTEDGVIIEDGGWGSSTGENDIWKTEDWSEVIKIKEAYYECRYDARNQSVAFFSSLFTVFVDHHFEFIQCRLAGTGLSKVSSDLFREGLLLCRLLIVYVVHVSILI